MPASPVRLGKWLGNDRPASHGALLSRSSAASRRRLDKLQPKEIFAYGHRPPSSGSRCSTVRPAGLPLVPNRAALSFGEFDVLKFLCQSSSYADRTYVMLKGEIVEQGTRRAHAPRGRLRADVRYPGSGADARHEPDHVRACLRPGARQGNSADSTEGVRWLSS
jgi:hypothetical protein